MFFAVKEQKKLFCFQLDYNALSPLCSSDEFVEGLTRLVVMAIDYANTLKPISDVSVDEKVIVCV